jgi:hypothetical protein
MSFFSYFFLSFISGLIVKVICYCFMLERKSFLFDVHAYDNNTYVFYIANGLLNVYD